MKKCSHDVFFSKVFSRFLSNQSFKKTILELTKNGLKNASLSRRLRRIPSRFDYKYNPTLLHKYQSNLDSQSVNMDKQQILEDFDEEEFQEFLEGDFEIVVDELIIPICEDTEGVDKDKEIIKEWSDIHKDIEEVKPFKDNMIELIEQHDELFDLGDLGRENDLPESEEPMNTFPSLDGYDLLGLSDVLSNDEMSDLIALLLMEFYEP